MGRHRQWWITMRAIGLASFGALMSSGASTIASAPSAAGSATTGIVPPNVPGRNFVRVGTADNSASWQDQYGRGCGFIPEQELPASEVADCIDILLASVDQARSYEGLGPMILPSNWSSLTATEQQFVVIDLERVARGLPAFTGDSTLVDQVVANSVVWGSLTAGDPSPPTYTQIYSWFGPGSSELSGVAGGGSGGDPIEGIAGYMYDDGCGTGPDGGFSGDNVDCVRDASATWSGTSSPSWGHRQELLMNDSATLSVCPQGGCWVGVALNGGDNAISAWEEVVVASSANSTTPATPTATFASSVDLYWADELQYLPACEQVVPADACTVATTVTATTSNANPAPGAPVTLSATLASTQGIPEGGSVSFADGSTPIAGCQNLTVANPGYDGLPASVAITVSCTAGFSASGSHSLSASYSGGDLGTTTPKAPLGAGVQGDMGLVAVYGPSTSQTVSITVPAQGAPGIVTSVSASQGDGSATVSWTPPASSGKSAITGYSVTASPGGATRTASASATSLDFTGLSNGTAYTFSVVADNGSGPGPISATSNPVTPSSSFRASGYWLVSSNYYSNQVSGFGSAPLLETGSSVYHGPAQAIAATPDGRGFFLLVSNPQGTVMAFGDAVSVDSSLTGTDINGNAVAIASTFDGHGFWIATTSGQVATGGDAVNYGSPAGSGLNLAAPIVSMAATPDGKGYWLLGQDGGVFTYGDASFFGSTGNMHLNAPVVSMTPTPDAGGYWFVASDGGIFSFGDASFYGSTGNLHLVAPVVAMAATKDGAGYWLFAADGGVFTFGDAPFYGSGAGTTNAPVVGAAATFHPSS